MYKVIKAEKMTLKELIEVLETLPQDYQVSMTGVLDMYINVDNKDNYIIFDEYNLNCYDGNTDEIKDENGAITGYIFADSDDTYGYTCNDDGHEEYGYSTFEKAENALLEYYYSNIDGK